MGMVQAYWEETSRTINPKPLLLLHYVALLKDQPEQATSVCVWPNVYLRINYLFVYGPMFIRDLIRMVLQTILKSKYYYIVFYDLNYCSSGLPKLNPLYWILQAS